MELLYTAHVPAGEGPHPTIIGLHGWGASAHDMIGLAPVLHRGEAIVLCPQGPVAIEAGPGVSGYGWFPLVDGQAPEGDAISTGLAALDRFIETACEKYPVDRRKLVLAGFSQGGFMAYMLGLHDPTRFAGLLAMSSWLPSEIAERIPQQPALAELPALVIHGSQDPMIHVDKAHEARDVLLSLKVPTVYREYEMGHEIRPEALREIVVWLEEKVLRPIAAV